MRIGFLALICSVFACQENNNSKLNSSKNDQASYAIDDVEAMLLPLSTYEHHTNHSKKVATIKVGDEFVEVTRCHQYFVRDLNHWNYSDTNTKRVTGEYLVCRDQQNEIIMTAEHGKARHARFRSIHQGSKFFNCNLTESSAFSPYYFSEMQGYECLPDPNVEQLAKDIFSFLDEGPYLPESGVPGTDYVPTNWTRDPQKTWANHWAAEFEKALPPGDYRGFSTSKSKLCMARVEKLTETTYELSIFGLNADGTIKRTNARALLSPEQTMGAWQKDGIMQQVSSKSRLANVFAASSETETTTKDYYADNILVVTYPDEPAVGVKPSIEDGYTALFVRGNYCQRLEPKIVR